MMQVGPRQPMGGDDHSNSPATSSPFGDNRGRGNDARTSNLLRKQPGNYFVPASLGKQDRSFLRLNFICLSLTVLEVLFMLAMPPTFQNMALVLNWWRDGDLSFMNFHTLDPASETKDYHQSFSRCPVTKGTEFHNYRAVALLLSTPKAIMTI